MRKRVGDAVVQHLRHLADQLGSEIAADDVAAERQRKPARALVPPLAEIDDLAQAVLGVRQLPFVDEQARVGLAVGDEPLDLIERHDDVLEIGLVESQREIGGRQRAGNRNPLSLHLRGAVLAGHDDRAVVVAHARAVRQQRVLVRKVRVGVERHRGDLVLAVEGGAVQRLDVGEDLVDLDAAGVDGARRQTVEHERVVRVRAVRDGDSHRASWAEAPTRGRSALTAAATRSIARSMSSAVLVRPRPKRIEARPRSPVAPMASITCETALLPDAHAEPVETARSLSAISSASPSTPSKLTWRLCASRGAMAPLTCTPSPRRDRSPSSSLSLNAPRRVASAAISVLQTSAAAPRPTMPGTLSVPALRPFSCPPPAICAGSAIRGLRRRTNSAPDPFGP